MRTFAALLSSLFITGSVNAESLANYGQLLSGTWVAARASCLVSGTSLPVTPGVKRVALKVDTQKRQMQLEKILERESDKALVISYFEIQAPSSPLFWVNRPPGNRSHYTALELRWISTETRATKETFRRFTDEDSEPYMSNFNHANAYSYVQASAEGIARDALVIFRKENAATEEDSKVRCPVGDIRLLVFERE